MTEQPQLTDRQLEVLDAIWEHWQLYQVPPTIRELMTSLNLTNTNSVVCHLKLLEAKGAIEWDRNGRSRMIFPKGLREKIKEVVG